MFTNNVPKTTDIIDDNLIRMFNEGPLVSFRGSPTVSPTTEALWQLVNIAYFFFNLDSPGNRSVYICKFSPSRKSASGWVLSLFSGSNFLFFISSSLALINFSSSSNL